MADDLFSYLHEDQQVPVDPTRGQPAPAASTLYAPPPAVPQQPMPVAPAAPPPPSVNRTDEFRSSQSRILEADRLARQAAGAGGPTRTVRPVKQVDQTTVAGRQMADPEDQAALDAFNQDRTDAKTDQQDVIADTAETRVGFGGELGTINDKFLPQYQSEVEREAEAYSAENKALDLQKQDVDEAQRRYGNAKVDPSRLFADASGPKKAGMILATLLGGIGKAFQHAGGNVSATNLAFEQIQQNIERDIDAQEKAIEVLRDRGQSEYFQYNQLLNSTKDRRAARSGQRALMLDVYGSQLKSLRDRLDNDLAISKLDQLLGQIEEQKALNKAAYLESTSPTIETQQSTTVGPARTVGGMNRKHYEKLFDAQIGSLEDINKTSLGIQRDRAKPKEGASAKSAAIPGYAFTGAVPPKETELNKLRNAAAQLEQYESDVKELQSLNEQIPAWDQATGASDPAIRAQAIRQRALMRMKDIYGLGALQKPEVEMLEKELPEPGQLFGRQSSENKRYEESIKGARQTLQRRLEKFGYVPAGQPQRSKANLTPRK